MSSKTIALTCLAAVLCGLALAAPPSDQEKKLMNRLMQRAELVSVMNVAHPEIFQEDNDPNTLQIVFMSDPNAKPRVSEDGEVVFLTQDTSIGTQSYLTQDAFYRKATRILEGKAPLPPGVEIPK